MRGENKRNSKEKSKNVQKEKGKTAERIKKRRKRRPMDWTKRFSSSDKWKIEKNKRAIKNSKMGSWEKW